MKKAAFTNLFFLFTITLFFNHLYADNTSVALLKAQLKSSTTDSAKVRIYIELSEVCDHKDILSYCVKAIQISEKL